MASLSNISAAEWKLMEIIWQNYPVAGSEVARLLRPRPNWHLKTVKTLLNRLMNKGVIDFEKRKNTYFYSPAISRSRYMENDSKVFIQRLFGGNTVQALIYFMQTTDLSDDEISVLDKLLKDRLLK